MNTEIIFALIAVALTIFQIIALYFVFKSTKVMAGKLASAFYKIGAGLLILIIQSAFLGWGWGYFKLESIPLYQSTAIGLNFAGIIFLIIGFRQLYNLLSELSKKR